MEPIHIENWEAFEKKLAEIRLSWEESGENAPLLYRGQSASKWNLETTLERSGHSSMPFEKYYRVIASIKPVIETQTGNAWKIPSYEDVLKLVSDYDEFSRKQSFGDYPAYDFMAYLRHHSFPSPLLDWSTSPYIAAYFAFRGVDLDSTEDVSIYVLRQGNISSIISSGTPRICRLGPYVRTHRRHALQQSSYTMCLVSQSVGGEWCFEKHEPTLGRESNGFGFSIMKIRAGRVNSESG